MRILFTLLCVILPLTPSFSDDSTTNEAERVAVRFARLALDCIHREYPGKISHVSMSDEDALPRRLLTPSFYGCFDWHSSVHGHWLLARLLRLYPKASFGDEIINVFEESFSAENLQQEINYFQSPGRDSFERPYGIAWVLQLSAELYEWKRNRRAKQWYRALQPLTDMLLQRFNLWLDKLSYPIRSGQHSQTAFALSLVWDWSVIVGREDIRDRLSQRILTFYGNDRACPLSYEPSGHDFLSPCLAEADLMRRILSPSVFSAWLGAFLPQIPLDASTKWLLPERVSDLDDGKLAHLDGLNLSRAWMLEGIARGLPSDDPRQSTLLATAKTHSQAGLSAINGEHYAGSHWLGSFATYLITSRGYTQGRKVTIKKAH